MYINKNGEETKYYKKLTEEEKIALKDYREYSINRLLSVQKVELELLLVMINDKKYNINDVFNQIQVIIATNLVLSRKYKNEKR